ncbi:MAG: dynamin family protein [Stigonema ocellatum SAG 48.90 = DSM 106950]|nr:dynamin family protein [Stigonema ocellatum SAG 48.90 = DSM 106950]
MPIQPFSKEIALYLAYASKYTYKLNTPISETVKETISKYSKIFEIEPFSYRRGDLSGFIGYFQHQDNKYITIAFRGSENIVDWLTNFQFIQAENFIGQGMVHSGFTNLVDDYYSEIEKIIEIKNNNKNLRLLLTGHSLGGAIAILMATRFSPSIVEAVYTYGAPRVGDEVFVKSYKPLHYRVEYGNDIVPHLPLNYNVIRLFVNNGSIPIEYQHTGFIKYLVKDKQKIEDDPGLLKRLENEICMGNFTDYFSQKNIQKNHSIDSYIEYLNKLFFLDEKPINLKFLHKENTDENQQIDIFINKAIKLAESVSYTDVVTELQKLKEYWHLPGFRLGFIGEFSRGKSTLINRLLNRNLLPVRAIPTTGCLISIVAGKQESLKVRSSQNEWEIRTIEESSWSDLLVNHQVSGKQNGRTEVCLTVNHPWLQTIDIELIDTPGVGDFSHYSTALLYEVLSKCDAAVILISAISPFSMTEAILLQQEVLGCHIPNVLVAVSKLDTIRQAEKVSVFEKIRERVMEISTKIPILPLHPLEPTTLENDALERVRTQIELMTSKGKRRLSRKIKVLNQLIYYLNLLIEIGQSVTSIELKNATDKEKVLSQADHYIKEYQLAWEDILRNFEQRRKQHEDKWNQKILDFKEDLKVELSSSLHNYNNIKKWSESVLPKFLKHKLSFFRKELEKDTLIVINDNFQWLKDEINQKFTQQIVAKDIDLPELNNFQIDPDYSPIVVKLSTIIAMIFGGVTGKIIELLGNLFTINTRDQQRRTLEQKLDEGIGQVVDQYCQNLSERLTKFYEQLIQETKKNQAVWRTAWESSLKTTVNEGGKDQWENLITQASALKQEIQSLAWDAPEKTS